MHQRLNEYQNSTLLVRIKLNEQISAKRSGEGSPDFVDGIAGSFERKEKKKKKKKKGFDG